ncbi:hypothetical protein KBY31_21300 [Ruegeria pomeroyi]|nr:hypothetical protein [Ruegeria pomeroyi]
MTQHFFRPSGAPEDDPKSGSSITGSEGGTFRENEGYGRRLRRLAANPRTTFVHIFIVVLEVALLAVQYVRMEALAFDVLPEIADVDLGFMYGSHLMGMLWVMIVIFVSYTTWECTIRLHERGKEASGALRASWIAFWLFNLAAMVFEFVLFRMLVDDFDSLGIAGAPELFGALMVAAHQAASFWIMKNVVRQLFLADDEKDL